MSSELPDGWRVDTLANLTEQVKRGAAPSYSDDATAISVISQKCVRDGIIDLAACRPHNPSKPIPVKAYLRPGDVCVNSTGTGTLGRVALWEHEGRRSFADTHVTVVRPDQTKVDPLMLAAFLGAPTTKDTIYRECVTGSTNQIELSTSAFSQLAVPVPPLDEQRRIAEVLRSVDDAITATNALLNGINKAKQATMEAVLSVGFDEVRLETLLAEARYPMRSGPFGSALLKAELQPNGIPCLGIDNVHVERFVPVLRRFVSEEKYRELARYTVYPGDVMVTIMGTVGRCCVVPPDMCTAISSKHVWTLTLDQDRYSSALLAWQINHSPPVLEQLQGSAQGGIMSAISSGTLRNLLVPLPSPVEVCEIEEVLLSFNAQLGLLESEQKRMTLLKTALTNNLLSGRVRVPTQVSRADPTVTPAFKRAVFAAEIVHQLHNDNRFGSVKHEKIAHLCELHLDLHNELDRHAYKKAAGPYDPVARRSVEQIFRQQKWFDTAKPDGKRVVYSALEKVGDHRSYFDRYFGDQKASIQSIIDLLRPLDTERCEMIATAYAVWNDFMIDGHQPSDEEMVASILAWHPRKARISEDRWSAVLPWMRQQGLVPRGTGEKTRTVST